MPFVSLQQARVLVIDDGPDAAAVAADILQKAGCREVLELGNATRAVPEYERFQPDLIILDLLMPEKSGLETLRDLRARTGEEPEVPILIIMAEPTVEARRQALAHGASDFLARPFDATELTLRAGHLLKAHFLQRQLRVRLQEETAAAAALEADYRAIFENLPVGFCQTTVEGHYLTANAALARIFGDASAEALTSRLGGCIADMYVQPGRRDEFLREIREQGEVEGFESQIRRRDGELIWIRENARVVWAPDGSVRRLEGTTEDVTRERLAEDALRHARAELERRVEERTGELSQANLNLQGSITEATRLASAIRNSPMAVVISDPALPDNPLTFVNPAFTRITGYEASEVLGKNCRFLQGAETDPALLAKLRQAIAQRESFQEILLNYRKDGTLFWNELTVSPVFDLNGELTHFVGLQLDVSERERALCAERESQRQLQALVQSIDEIVFEIGADGRYINVWTCDETLLAAPREEIIGRTITEVLGEEAAAPFCEALTRVIASGEAESITYRMDVQAGPRWFLARLNPIMGADGRAHGVCLLSRDMTGQHQIEIELRQARDESERANAAKSEFLSRMSHELRTPLNAILGFGQLMEMEKLDAPAHSNLDQILKAGRHLLELINEVLQISGIEAGRMEITLEPVHAGTILREACALVRPMADDREIQLSLAQDDFDWHVLADRQRLMQVLLNFIFNAVKFNRAGGNVFLLGEELEDGFQRIAVRDDGPGIAPEDQAKLFTPFERLATHRTSAIEGTGLGLALSRKLVERMDGTVGMESTVGAGSTFWFTLPRAAAPEKASPFICEQPETGFFEASMERQQILYIEDNFSNLRLIQQIFSEWPQVKLLSAMQGRVGLDLALRHCPDLILLDAHLPDVPGDEVLRELRQNSLTHHIPVLMLSADATPRTISRFLDAGASGYLTKPIDVRQFLRTVGDRLDRKGIPS